MFNPKYLSKIALFLFLYYDNIKRCSMEFFREHKKIIIGVIAVSFIVWTVGLSLLMLMAPMGN